MGTDLYAEDVTRAAYRVKEPRLSAGFKLPPEIRYEHLDRVGHGEWVIPPHLVEQALARDDDALVAHQVLEQLKLPLREVDRSIADAVGSVAARDLVGVGVEL